MRSICCLIGGRCPEDEPKPTSELQADLGQKEAELEKTGKEQMSHMESSAPNKRKPRR
jgi:hypothetical protein